MTRESGVGDRRGRRGAAGARLAVLPLAAAAVLAAGAPAPGGEATLIVRDAWARATPGKAPNGAAFFTVENRGPAADRLVAAASEVSRRAEIHAHLNDGGVMRMRRVAGADIAAGRAATFEPGGLHVMLLGLRAPLRKGGSFEMELTFEKAGTRTVRVVIAGVGAMGPGRGRRGGGEGSSAR